MSKSIHAPPTARVRRLSQLTISKKHQIVTLSKIENLSVVASRKTPSLRPTTCVVYEQYKRGMAEIYWRCPFGGIVFMLIPTTYTCGGLPARKRCLIVNGGSFSKRSLLTSTFSPERTLLPNLEDVKTIQSGAVVCRPVIVDCKPVETSCADLFDENKTQPLKPMIK